MSPALVVGATIGVVVAATTLWALVDLTRCDVAYLPKWAWGVGIVLLSVIGVAAYAVFGRIPQGADGPMIARLSRQTDEQPSTGGELMIVGMAIGLAIGTALGQLALGMAVGLAVGAALDAYRAHQSGH